MSVGLREGKTYEPDKPGEVVAEVPPPPAAAAAAAGAAVAEDPAAPAE
jgi:hypothetical protein